MRAFSAHTLSPFFFPCSHSFTVGALSLQLLYLLPSTQVSSDLAKALFAPLAANGPAAELAHAGNESEVAQRLEHAAGVALLEDEGGFG